MERKHTFTAVCPNLDGVAEIVARIAGVNSTGIFTPGKERRRVQASSLLCFWAVRELGITLAALARRSRIFQSSIVSAASFH